MFAFRSGSDYQMFCYLPLRSGCVRVVLGSGLRFKKIRLIRAILNQVVKVRATVFFSHFVVIARHVGIVHATVGSA